VIVHRGQHWPVGHGGFYTAEVWCEPAANWFPFRYVYDCGALTRPPLDAAIDDYFQSIRRGQVDLVVISHVDADHVKGLKRLVEGSSVRRVMLPLLAPIDRLIALARSAELHDRDGGDPADDPGHDDQSFGLDFFLHPERILEQYGIEVVFVSGDDDGPPMGPNPIIDPDPPWTPDAPDEELDDEPDHHPAPMDRPRRDDESADSRPDERLAGAGPLKPSHGGRAVTMSHRNALILRDKSGVGSWLLAPYVSPRISARRDAFLDVLAGITDRPSPDPFDGSDDTPQDIEANRSNRADLVEHREAFAASLASDDLLRTLADHLPLLRRAYRAAGGTNAGSMSLYSGPLPQNTATTLFDLDRVPLALDAPALLMTGDSKLNSREAVGALAHHYTGFTASVGVLHVPHHGSKHNFRTQLLAALPNMRYALAMVPEINKTGTHPSVSVRADVQAAKIGWHEVSSLPQSAVVTRVEVR
jgi:hypothetical protein